MTAPAPRTDTDAALTRIQAIARLAGLVVRVGPDPVRDAALAFCGRGDFQTPEWWTALYRLQDAVRRDVAP